MIALTPHVRIFVATKATDLRKGFDALSAYCRDELAMDPLSGVMFVFTNRCRTHLRLLFYDGQGLWICTKRLSKGTFPWWPKCGTTNGNVAALTSQKLQILLWGGSGDDVKLLSDWRPIKQDAPETWPPT